MNQPKIILWDLETSFNVVAVFRLFGQDYINHENLLQERFVICGCWKELGEKKVHSVATTDNPKRFKANHNDDYHVVKTMHDVLSSADVIVAHNGDAYDLRFWRARAIFHGLPPLPPVITIDTLKVARSQFMFNSNKLDYLGQFLGVGRKKKTESGLWLRVLQGDKKAIQAMVEYNKGDVELLEDVFLKLQPYIPNHVNRALFGQNGCPRCGKFNIQSRGVHRALTRTYQRFQCQDCSGWFRLLKADKGSSTETRVL